MVVNQLVFTHRALRKNKLSHFPIRYYIVLDVPSLMRQNWLLYSTGRANCLKRVHRPAPPLHLVGLRLDNCDDGNFHAVLT